MSDSQDYPWLQRLGLEKLLLIFIPVWNFISYWDLGRFLQQEFFHTLLMVLCFVFAATIFLLDQILPNFKQHIKKYIIGLIFLGAACIFLQLFYSQFSIYSVLFLTVYTIFTGLIYDSNRDMVIYLSLMLAFTVGSFLMGADLPPDTKRYIYIYAFASMVYYFLSSYTRYQFDFVIKRDNSVKELMDSQNDGVVQVGPDGRIVYANRTFSEFTQYELESLIDQKKLIDLFIPDDQELIKQSRNNLQNDESRVLEVRLTKPNNQIMWLRGRVVQHHDYKKGSSLATFYFQKIEKEKRLEAELRNLVFEHDQLEKKLESRDFEMEHFSKVASTDLKGPLNQITQLLSNPPKGPEETTEKIRVQAERMKDLIDALLIYSLSGKNQYQPIFVDLNEIMKEVISGLEFQIHSNNAKVHYFSLPSIWADRIQMIRLFRNMLENAIKFRGKENPIITVTHSLDEENDRFVFAVEDNGIGISPELYEEVFLIFRKFNKKDSPGLGMGLALCKKIVEIHKGKMWLRSAVGQGTTFYFTLPAEKSAKKIAAQRD
ncbi:MAG: ATP-binding protein [Bacteroidota bacterium]